LLLEGSDIEALLEQIREEYGSGARIVSADKVRTGGVGGFFAKQRYEVAVEVDELLAPPAPPASAAVELVDAAEPAPQGDPSLAALLELVEASQDRFRRLPEPAEAQAEVPVVRPLPRGTQVSTTRPAFAEIMAGFQTELARPETPAVAPAEVAPAVVAAVPAEVPAMAAVPAEVPASDPPSVDLPPRASVGGPLTEALVEVGVPVALAARATSHEPYAAVREALRTVPAPPEAPANAGDVLVIVGELAHALPVARRVAGALHLDSSKIMFAAASTAGVGLNPSRRISGPAEAQRLARTMRRADTPHVVVVDSSVHAGDDDWAISVCDALSATAVWAVIDATRKTAESRRYLALVGPVDALAVHGAMGCADPASVLALDVPVALLDQSPATPGTWAALLAPLVAEAAE
jgi:hypothetical protein